MTDTNNSTVINGTTNTATNTVTQDTNLVERVNKISADLEKVTGGMNKFVGDFIQLTAQLRLIAERQNDTTKVINDTAQLVTAINSNQNVIQTNLLNSINCLPINQLVEQQSRLAASLDELLDRLNNNERAARDAESFRLIPFIQARVNYRAATVCVLIMLAGLIAGSWYYTDRRIEQALSRHQQLRDVQPISSPTAKVQIVNEQKTERTTERTEVKSKPRAKK